MAQQGPLTDLDKLSCFSCSEQLGHSSRQVDRCGHIFCMSCTRKHRESKEDNTFSSAFKNTALTPLTEQQKITETAVDECNTGVRAVACDFCTVRKRRASKSCMQCLVSYCEEHLQSHHGVPAQKKHKLTEPIENLHENLCSQHKEVKRLFCFKCEECICYLCQLEEHKDHNCVEAEGQIRQSRNDLQAEKQTAQQAIQALEKNIDLLQQEEKAINKSADKVVRENENKLKQFIQMSMNLTERIKQQQKIEVTRVQGLLKTLKQELDVERQRSAELELIAHIKSHSEFLKKFSSVSYKRRNLKSMRIPAIQGLPLKYFDHVSKAVSNLNETCIKGFEHLAQRVTEVDVLLPQNPQSDQEFLHYSIQPTLSNTTTSKALVLSEKNTKVSSVQSHAPELMDKASKEVMSMNSLPPRCYWEVEWTGLCLSVGVAYKDMGRKGPQSGLGSNDQSWALEWQSKRGYVYRHNGEQKFVSGHNFSRVGVFLDHKAGILCFYEVSETKKLIHKVETTFTQPLYAALGLYFYSVTAKMCDKEAKKTQTLLNTSS